MGAPDADEIFKAAAHCDDADFLPGSYPRTRAQATTQLLDCVRHLRSRFAEGVTTAGALLDSQGRIRDTEVNLRRDCQFVPSLPGRAKCNAIEGLGRALHGAQDFYSHSNWADEADSQRRVDSSNPPGLGLPAPSPVLDLRGTAVPDIPPLLSTGCWNLFDRDPGIRDCQGRVTHAALNKDKGWIDPGTGAVRSPDTPRGQVRENFAKAVAGAIIETRRQWQDMRSAISAHYGPDRGQMVICALTHDNPIRDCQPRA